MHMKMPKLLGVGALLKGTLAAQEVTHLSN